MRLEKQAAVNMLVAEGVDFDSAVELVMEKVAGTGASIVFQGSARTERKIAKQHNQEGPKEEFWRDYKQNSAASYRAAGKGLLGGAATSTAAYLGASKLAANAVKRGAINVRRAKIFGTKVGVAGALAGYAGGAAKSFHNQGKEMNKKYQEKQAAVSMLMAEGIDFDLATNLVMEKSAVLGTFAGASSSTKDHRWGGAGVGLLAGHGGKIIGGHLGGMKGALMGNAAAGALAGHLYGKHATKKDSEKKAIEKQAAVSMLMVEGIDFDYAVDLVTSKSQELYAD